jgi:hypothetical protein
MKTFLTPLLLCCTILSANAQSASQPPKNTAVPVTVENFVRAGTDFYMGDLAVRRGFLGKLYHYPKPAPVEHQVVVRSNRDEIVSSGVFDLDGSSAITLPDAGKRFRSLLVVNEDHYMPIVAYDAGDYPLTRKKIGTRYLEATDNLGATGNQAKPLPRFPRPPPAEKQLHLIDRVKNSAAASVIPLRVKVQGTARHGRLSDFDQVFIRVAHVASQFSRMNFWLSNELRAS